MSAWRPINRTADGQVTFMRPDPAGGWEFKTVTDVREVLAENQRLAAAGHNGFTTSRAMKHVASIPLALVDQWAREGLDVMAPGKQQAEIRRRLNDIDFRSLRVGGGSL